MKGVSNIRVYAWVEFVIWLIIVAAIVLGLRFHHYTNKRSTTQYTTSGKPLQTGQLNWPIPVLAVCGLAFIGGGLALILRKKRGSYGK